MNEVDGRRLSVTQFERVAGIAAFLVAVGALVYSALFIAIVEGSREPIRELWFFTLMLGGLGTVPVVVALYLRFRDTEPGLALTALVLGLGAAAGGVLHGSYELGTLVTPIGDEYRPGPEAVSHGILRYGVAGLFFLLLGWLIQRGRELPSGLGYLAYFGGAALVFIYIGRLFDFIQPGDYFSLLPPIVYGFAIHPLFYLWVGRELWRGTGSRALARPA
jgi:hypothetical protein